MQPVAPSGATQGGVSSPSPDEIRAHVARVLASPAFRASKRCHRFLDFIVTQLLEGHASTIKERTLATEVFDRSASWDSGGDDTIVRVGAREVRKRLAQFYSSPEGMQEKIRVELPLGSYVPEVVRLDYPLPMAPVGLAAATHVEAIPLPVARSRRHYFWIAGTAVAALITAAVYGGTQKPSPFMQFWSPFVHSPEPVLVAVAAPLVYSPSARAYGLDSERWGSPTLGVARPLRLDPHQLNGADFVPVPDQYLAFGDSIAATNVQVMLATHSKDVHVRFASRVEFAEFRDAPVILIGAFTNRWTIEFTQHFRYHFGYDNHWIPAIIDSAKPGHTWNIPQKQDNGTSPEDYFLVCRLPSSPSGTPMLIAGGVAQFGTEAAGRFLSDPSHLATVLKGLGQDWQNKNVEIVMHDKVIGNSPAAPELVASYVW
jgi:hypothetical protein